MKTESLQTHLVDYDLERYPLPEIVRWQFGVDELDEIHTSADYPLLTRENDQKTVFHERFYVIGDEFFDTYHRLLVEVVQPLFGENLIYQRVPTFRVHLPGNVAVGEMHRDRDYSHGQGEVNLWLPFTRAWDTNTVWIESSEGSNDVRPYACDVGQMLMFDGVNLLHGNVKNETGKTRVSVDFRVIPESQYVAREAATINTKLSFTVGGYFADLAAG
ncbi:MAG: streptomycin biosynthesis protein StrG [Actinobacteria bacterium]|nr:streptomycin biosynthesis protein StrG [Actinomycetota bacterium]